MRSADNLFRRWLFADNLFRRWVFVSTLWSVLVLDAHMQSPFTYSIDLPLVGTVLWNTRAQIIAALAPWMVGSLVGLGYLAGKGSRN